MITVHLIQNTMGYIKRLVEHRGNLLAELEHADEERAEEIHREFDELIKSYSDNLRKNG